MKILKRPLVELVIKPSVDFVAYTKFLQTNYGVQSPIGINVDNLLYATTHPGDTIPVLAGKACYKAWDKGRPSQKEYLENIMRSKHFSVVEHATFGFIIVASRSITHEMVRHRLASFSQESQRFCDEKDNAFIMPISIQGVPKAEAVWYRSIEKSLNDYVELVDTLMPEFKNNPEFKDLSPTDLRKKVREAARGVLPNDTAAVIHMTTNIRSWRHFLDMRASRHAQVDIRAIANEIYNKLIEECPILFGDYKKEILSDGTFELKSEFSEVS